jgi:hypothetical protein
MYSVQYNGYNLIGVTTVERGDGSYDSTSLFLYISRLLYLGTIHCTQQGLGALLYGSYRSEAKNQSPQGSPRALASAGKEEVRGPSSEAVSAGVADTAADFAAEFAAETAGAADSAAVETLLAPPVPGVQKPPRWVGKRFRDRFAAAPLKV